MFCKNCGKELKEGAKFCTGCGTAVTPINANGDGFSQAEASDKAQSQVVFEPSPDRLNANNINNTSPNPYIGNQAVPNSTKTTTFSAVGTQSKKPKTKIIALVGGLAALVLIALVTVIVLLVAKSHAKSNDYSQSGDDYEYAYQGALFSDSELTEAFSQCRYTYGGTFSISMDELIPKAISDYKITFFTGEEAISNGYIERDQVSANVDMNYLYFVIVSGNTKVNPELPYMTTYYEKSVSGWMILDESGNLRNYEMVLCKDLQTFATIFISQSMSSY